MLCYRLTRKCCILLGFLFISSSFAVTHPVVRRNKNTVASETTSTQTQTKNTTVKQPPSRLKSVSDRVVAAMSSLTPTKRSALEARLKSEKLIAKTLTGVAFYKPTYLLPFYHTGSPYDAVYERATPDDQKIEPVEFKAQFSFQFPIWQNILGSGSTFSVAYTQMMYWQVYTDSPYFRETNYEPELFVRLPLIRNWWLSVGAEHQSNGRGGALERSWNRAYLNLLFSGKHWMVSLRPWTLIFRSQSIKLHNPAIADFMGHGEFIFAYKFNRNVLSLTTRNNLESGFKRGAVELNYSFRIHGILRGYIQFFSGYGQSLIEYDHHTNSVGAGIALNDWI